MGLDDFGPAGGGAGTAVKTAPGFHALSAPRPAARSRPAVFLDRDGTLIHDRPGFYLSRPDQVRFYRGTFQALRLLARAGFELVVVSNQSGIARGFLDEPTLRRVHKRLLGELKRGGIRLAGIYFCVHGPRDGCACRKPKPTLALRAARRHRLDVGRSYVVGDKRADVELARALGVPSVHLLTGHGRRQRAAHGHALRPTHRARNLLAAAHWIVRHAR